MRCLRKIERVRQKGLVVQGVEKAVAKAAHPVKAPAPKLEGRKGSANDS